MLFIIGGGRQVVCGLASSDTNLTRRRDVGRNNEHILFNADKFNKYLF